MEENELQELIAIIGKLIILGEKNPIKIMLSSSYQMEVNCL